MATATQQYNFDAIPQVLKDKPRWVIWRYEEREGKQTKVPYQARRPKARADATRAATWGTFAQAVAASSHADGIGFVLGDGWAGVDLDDCIDPDTGHIQPWAQEWLDRFATYTETSPSKTGVKLFLHAEALHDGANGHKRGDVEAYIADRFFTTTGWHIYETPATVEDRQDVLIAFSAQYFSAPTTERGPKAEQTDAPQLTLDDQALLEKARSAKNGSKFEALWRGDDSPYDGDESRGDLAFCMELAFWTQDPEQIDRIVRRSDRYRDKWDEKRGALTYGQQTILKALSSMTEYYSSVYQKQATASTGMSDRAESTKSGDKKPADKWQPTIQTAEELMRKELPPVRWVVKDIISEGVTLLAAKAKKGKSTLMLHVAMSVGLGALALGTLITERSDVLYLALEDNERRMQRRMRKMLPEGHVPAGLSIAYKWLPLERGGVTALESYLDEHPTAHLVIVDTLHHVRTPSARGNGYAEDYAACRELQRIAGERQIAIVVITHLRKAPAEDPFDEINATSGLLAGVDNALVMRPAGRDGIMELHRRGREFEDDSTLALKGDKTTFLWRFEGAAAEVERSTERTDVLNALKKAGPAGMTPGEIALELDKPRNAVDFLLHKLVNEDQPQLVRKGRGRYIHVLFLSGDDDPQHPGTKKYCNAKSHEYGPREPVDSVLSNLSDLSGGTQGEAQDGASEQPVPIPTMNAKNAKKLVPDAAESAWEAGSDSLAFHSDADDGTKKGHMGAKTVDPMPHRSSGPLCPVTRGAHVYAMMRTADGRRQCIECFQPEERQASA